MIGGMDVEAMPDRGWKRAFDEPIPRPRARRAPRSPPVMASRNYIPQGSRWFRGDQHIPWRQRLMRRLYPTEYRQPNDRPSCEHENPVQHRDIVRRIWTQDTRYRRDMPVVVPSRE